MPDNNQHNRRPQNRRFTIIDRHNQPVENQHNTVVDQRHQRVENQHNTAFDQRDQRDQRIENQYVFNGDPTAVLFAINRSRSGVVFQPKILGLWLILCFVIVILMCIASLSSGKIISLLDFLIVTCTFFISCVFYGFIGIIIQGALHYQWKFSSVRNSWLVWCFYPILSLFVIALWILWLIFKFGPLLFRNQYWF